MNSIYICIDLKSFFASVECVERGLDPMTTNLVVADPSRGQGGICLAITPAMKALGIKNRCRIYEIPSSVEYITALPRMKKYMEYSTKIFSIYMSYISPEDIHVYSIDECFIDITQYMHLYNMSAKELSKMLMDEVFKETGICATCGIGTNLFLAKVALDITAKHTKDHLGFLNEDEYKKTIWNHKPITDIWNVGRGIAKRLEKYGVTTMYGVTTIPERVLYKEFGVNAEYLIDHAYGRESCTIKDIHEYKSSSMSLSNSQILFEDYNYDDSLIVLKEMVDLMVLELVDRHLVTNNISLGIGYSKDVMPPTGGSKKLNETTNSFNYIVDSFIELYKKTTIPDTPIRRLSISMNNLVNEDYSSFSIFTPYEMEKKEKCAQKAIIDIKNKYGKNAIMRGTSFQEKATGRVRNKLIGGHNSGES